MLKVFNCCCSTKRQYYSDHVWKFQNNTLSIMQKTAYLIWRVKIVGYKNWNLGWNKFLEKRLFLGSRDYSKDPKMLSVQVFWTRLASFGQLGIINWFQSSTMECMTTKDKKKIHVICTILEDMKTFYHRQTAPLRQFLFSFFMLNNKIRHLIIRNA